MWQSLLGYVLIALGGVLWGIAITIYWCKKCRVIHDLFGLILCLIVSVLLIWCGIDMVEVNVNQMAEYNPVIVEHLDLNTLNKS